MTEQEAIAVLELQAIGLTGLISGMRKENPLYDVVQQRLSAIDLAQRALKERMEREGRCEWCDYFAQDPTYYFSEGNGMYKTIQYRFCPMCGRQLEEDV